MMARASATLLVTLALAAGIAAGGSGVACSSSQPLIVQPPKSCTLQVVGMTIIASPTTGPTLASVRQRPRPARAVPGPAPAPGPTPGPRARSASGNSPGGSGSVGRGMSGLVGGTVWAASPAR